MTRRFENPEPLREVLRGNRSGGHEVGFVPTMGALHRGHRRVLSEARSSVDRLVASVFVNPTQFDTDRDAEVYPRHPEEDFRVLEEEGVDYAYYPSRSTMYPPGDATEVHVVLPMTRRYEGEVRPRFFAGVARVVSKLLNQVPADHAFFGEKDLQQYIMLRRMVRDLHFPHTLHPVPVERDERGVAYSSRNRNFTGENWESAARVHELMIDLRRRVDEVDRSVLEGSLWDRLEEAGLDLQYLDVVDFPGYEPVELSDRRAVLILAGHLGDVRLKDNLPLHVETVRELQEEG